MTRLSSTATAIARALVAALSVIIALQPRPAMAWGTEGHQAVAAIANSLLDPAARAHLDALLAIEPGATLTSISTWADDTRDRSTAAWHYVNMPRGAGCLYDRARDCPDGRCVVEALNAQIQRLNAGSAADQLEALKYVVHFVADVHQPLHAAFADDRGGNTYQLQAFGRGTNLHAVWDSQLLRSSDARSMVVAGSLSASNTRWTGSLLPSEWGKESCLIASRPDFYPSRQLDDEYLRTFRPIARERVYAAGARLAAVLNAAFGAQRAPVR
jgi:nuclease S1